MYRLVDIVAGDDATARFFGQVRLETERGERVMDLTRGSGAEAVAEMLNRHLREAQVAAVHAVLNGLRGH